MAVACPSFDLRRDLPDIEEELWGLIQRVPPGRVTTCGALAAALGAPQAARWIGQRLLHHEHGPGCPCHRVVRAEGVLGGFPAGGTQAKARRLLTEGVVFKDGRVDLAQCAVEALRGKRPLARLARIQQELSEAVSERGSRRVPRLVAGLDVSYNGSMAFAAYSLCELSGDHGLASSRRRVASLLRTVVSRRHVAFPYISSFLAFRELPILLNAVAEAEASDVRADVLLVDGSGILHPRGCGIASMLGVLLGRTTIGVTKKLLAGSADLRGMRPGEVRDVRLGGRCRGVAIRPRTGTARPLYISPGHRIGVTAAARLVERLLTDADGRPLRLPLPIGAADRLSRAAARKIRPSAGGGE